MRLTPILVPLSVALAVAGGIVYYASIKPAAAAFSAGTPFVVSEVRHPVSKEMIIAADLLAKKTAPFFKVKDAHGIDVQIGGAGKKPQFVYFILSGCPCSLDAQPLFNKMYMRFKDKVDFIGIINVGKAKALDYAGDTTVLHPLVCDEDHKIIKAFDAKQSTYNILIRPNGTIEKAWPGYWQDSLHELNHDLALLTKTPETPFDAAFAPVKKTSGCYF